MDDLTSSPPNEIDPYATLGLPDTATAAEVKTAYRKLALRNHPDKASPEAKESAHVTFQRIAFAYAILSDDRRRKRYDATGNTSESLEIDDDDFNWTDFFRAQLSDAVTTTSINDFKNNYQGSEEERTDILNAYTKSKGNMNKIFTEVMLSNPLQDEERFKTWIDENIKMGTIESYDRYVHESSESKGRRRKKAEREAIEAEEHLEDLESKGKVKKAAGKGKENGIGDLAAMIQQRQQGRAKNFLDDLEAKYASPATAKNGGNSARGKKRKEEEPPEEAFQKNAARAQKKRKSEVEEGLDEDDDEEEDVDLDEGSAFSGEKNDSEDFKPKKSKKRQTTKTTNGKSVRPRRKK